MTGNDPVAGIALFLEAKVGRAMNDEFIELLERPFVEKEVDALAGR